MPLVTGRSERLDARHQGDRHSDREHGLAGGHGVGIEIGRAGQAERVSGPGQGHSQGFDPARPQGGERGPERFRRTVRGDAGHRVRLVVALDAGEDVGKRRLTVEPSIGPDGEAGRTRERKHAREPTRSGCHRVVGNALLDSEGSARRPMTDVLELADVTVVRSGHRLLDRITWAVAEGDRWAVLGPNGAGKTTLLQIASAQMHPTTGYAAVLGEILGAVDVFELRPRIGLTSAALAERIPRSESVRDVVVTASYAVVGRWREEYEGYDVDRAAALLRQLGVGHLVDRTFGTLSEGERKRVQIARALMTDPELLLLDEPAAGLDLAGREALVRTLSELALDPYAPASVLVTHHVEEIPDGITHALLMRSGRVIAAGELRDTLTSDHLSATFELPLNLEESGGRWVARAV